MATLANLSVMISANTAALRRNLRSASRDVHTWAKRSTRAARSVERSLINVALAFGGISGAMNAVQRVDSMTMLESRMKSVTGSAEGAGQAIKSISRIAYQSRSQIEAVGELYTKLAISTEHLKIEESQLAAMTQTVVDTFLLSGASGSEAANSARQFAQGLASGRLQGDELRSVLENNVVLAKLLADGFGVTVGQLRLMGENGELTADKMVNILGAAFDSTRKKAADMELTFGQAAIRLSNRWTEVLNRFQKTTGWVTKLADGVGWVAANIDNLVAAATPLVITLGGLLVYWVGILAIAHPLGAAIAGIAAAMSYAAFWAKENSKVIAKVMFRVFNVQIPTWVKTAQIAFLEFQNGLMNNAKFIETAVNTVIRGINKLIDIGNSAAQGLIPDWVLRFFGIDPGTEIFGKVSELDFGKTIDDNIGHIVRLKDEIQALAELDMSLTDIVLGQGRFNSGPNEDNSGGPNLPGEKIQTFVEGLKQAFEDIKESWNLLTVSMDTGWDQILNRAAEGSTKLTAIMQGAAIAQTIMNTARAIMEVWADPSLPTFWAKMGAAAKVAAIGALNIATIKGQAHDGLDNVPSTGTYLLEKGERVVDSRLNKDLSSFLDGGRSGGSNEPMEFQFNVSGVEDPEIIKKMLRKHRGEFESMIRDVYADNALNSPF